MSLVNDALRKARLEAERHEADRTDAILPTLGQVGGDSIPPRPALPVIAGAVAVLALVAVAVWLYGAFPESKPPSPSTTDLSDTVSAVEPTPLTGPAEQRDNQPAVTRQPSSVARQVPTRPATPPANGEDGVTETRQRLAQAGTASQSAGSSLQAATEITSAERRSAPPSTGGVTGTPERPETAPPVRNVASATSSPRRPSAPSETVPEQENRTPGESRPASRKEPEPAAEPQGSPQRENVEAVPEPPAQIGPFLRQASIPGLGTFSLDGIAWSSDRPFALVNGEVVGPGGSVSGAKMIEVAQDAVVLEKDGTRFRITLR